MKRRSAVLVVALAALAGCGGDGGAAEAVSQTGANLSRIRSGELDTRLLIAATGGKQDGALGFAVKGPFALPAKPGLPIARVAYTQIAGPRQATTTLVATGRQAFIEVGGVAYRLPPREVKRLELAGDVRAATGGGLEVDRWLREPELEDGPDVAGAPTDRITGELDVARAVNDLLGLADRAGAEAAGIAPLRGARAEDLQESVRSGRVELLTGTDDRLLRRLSVDVELDAPKVRGPSSLPELESVKIDFDLSLSRPNAPVRVAAPRNARSFEELDERG